MASPSITNSLVYPYRHLSNGVETPFAQLWWPVAAHARRVVTVHACSERKRDRSCARNSSHAIEPSAREDASNHKDPFIQFQGRVSPMAQVPQEMDSPYTFKGPVGQPSSR
jgi:hypothetical protein